MTQQVTQLLAAPFGHIKLSLMGDDVRMRLSDTPINHQEISAQTHPLLAMLASATLNYLDNPQFTPQSIIAIETLGGTAFQQRVWQAISDIPVGQTRTYSDIAKTLHSGPRAVANACGANHLPILIPCHRVVAKQGIGGFMGKQTNGVLIKRWLLQHEGVVYD